MTRPRSPRLTGPEAALFGLAALALASQASPRLAVINETPSLPRGLYVRVPAARPERGAVVALAPPPTTQAYLAGLGMPQRARLLKRIAATGGDQVCARDGRLEAPGRRVAVRSRDHRGVPLPAWTACGPLAPGEVFLLGDSPDSFDSRYFGPVRQAELDGVFRPVLTW